MPSIEPDPDPVPTPRQAMLSRFARIMTWMTLVSIVVAVIAVVLVASGDEGFHLHMMIATALGVGLTVLLGTGLMTLVYLSSSSGHDDQATGRKREDE